MIQYPQDGFLNPKYQPAQFESRQAAFSFFGHKPTSIVLTITNFDM